MDQVNDCVQECSEHSFAFADKTCVDCPDTCTSCKNKEHCNDCVRGY